MYYVYVLESDSGDLYFGSTNDLRRRLNEHNTGQSRSTRNATWELIYYEAYRSENDALQREARLKHHGQAKRQLKERFKLSRRRQG